MEVGHTVTPTQRLPASAQLASPYDRIWGIGMAPTNPSVQHPSAWRGLNLLGFALMDVRDHLHADTPESTR